MVFLGYLFTAINYAFYCASRFAAKKEMILFMDLISKIFTILGLYCLNSLSGALSFSVTFFLLVVANIKERKNKKWTAGFIFFQLAYLFILIFNFEGISSLLVFTTSSISLTCTWWLVPQKMRIVGGLNSVLFLLYQISIKNWAGLIEILVILSNLISYLKYRKKANK